MTGPELYEKCVSLGLCEMATSGGYPIEFLPNGAYIELGDGTKHFVNEAEDLACMTVLRALLREGNVLTRFSDLVGDRWSVYVGDIPNNEPRHMSFACPTYLASLCLCLLRAKGKD